MTESAIRTVVRRPPAAGDQALDNARRILGARAAVTAAMLMAVPTVAALLLSMGGPVHGTCPSSAEETLSLVMLATGGLLALISAGGWAAALLSGTGSVVPRVSP